MIPGLTATSQIQTPVQAPMPTLRLTAVSHGKAPAINPVRAIANVSFHERLSNTVKTMVASPLFSSELKEVICKWKQDFDAGFSKTLQGGNMNVSLALGAIICTVIHPALVPFKNEGPEKVELESYELILTVLIKQALPPKNDLNQFITLCQMYFEKQAFVEKQMEIVERIFQEATDEVYERANELNAEIEKNFLELERLLGTINGDQQKEMGAIHEEVKILAGHAETQFNELESFRCNQLVQQAKLKAVKEKYLQFLEQSKSTLKRLS